MKKTLTVNLGGRVFHIDEDAYQLLDKYLTNLRIYFSKEEGSDEILDDFESRISELFNEYIKLGYDVIPITRVEEVIRQMGKPEEIFGEEFMEEEEEKKEEEKWTKKIRETVNRRLYRNPDDRILGGVASGIAAYMGWNPAVVRLIWFLITFFYGLPLVLYFALWLALPLAGTATERLLMRGETITVETIGRTVTDGFEKASGNINEYITSPESKSIFQRLLDILVSIVSFITKFAFVCFSVIFIPVMLLLLFVFVTVFGSLMIGATGFLTQILPDVDWHQLSGLPEGMLLIISFCMIILIGIPLVSAIYSIISYFFKFKPVNNTVKWTLIFIWLIALAGIMYAGVMSGASAWDILENWDQGYNY